MTAYICVTCGVQYAESESAPARCVICEEERQYVNAKGQLWTTLAELRTTHRNRILEVEPGLTGIGSEPSFAIGQRALLVHGTSRLREDRNPNVLPTPATRSSSAATPTAGERPEGGQQIESSNSAEGRTAAQMAGTYPQEGGVLWDCISLVDDMTVKAVHALGGVRAIAISHPHFYSSMIEWSRALGGVPVYLHADDREWVMRPDPTIRFWEGDTHALGDGLTLIRCGGHFAGSTALHWAGGAEGRGALLTADTLTVVSDSRYVSFMYSFPNLIPLPKAAIEGIVRSVEPFAFDRIHGGWWERSVAVDAKAAVARSAERYVRASAGG